MELWHKRLAGGLLICVVYLVVYSITSSVLADYGLCFRTWTSLAALWVVAIGVVLALILASSLIGRKHWRHRSLMRKLVLAVGLIIESCLLVIGLFVWATGTEHLTIRDGIKMVAMPLNFLDDHVTVDYYAYHNLLVRGSDRILTESYKPGIEDPFRLHPMPAPESVDYWKK